MGSNGLRDRNFSPFLVIPSGRIIFFLKKLLRLLIVNTLSLNIQFLRMDMSFELMKVFMWYWTGIGISRVLFLFYISVYITRGISSKWNYARSR